MKKIYIYILLLVVITICSNSKCLASPAYTFDNATADLVNSTPWTLGWSFVVENSFYVNSLGVFDYNLDGLNDIYEVGIFDDSGTLLVSTYVDNNDPLINQFRYNSVQNTFLSEGGLYYIGALYLNAVDEIIFPNPYSAITNFQTNPMLTYLESNYAAGATLTAPTDTYPGATYYGFFGPNFNLTPVPEPSTFLLLGGGLTGLAFFARRKKKA